MRGPLTRGPLKITMRLVLAHLADVLKHEAQRLEHAVLDVELGHSVLVHQSLGGRISCAIVYLYHNGNTSKFIYMCIYIYI